MGIDEKFKIGEEVHVNIGTFFEPKWVRGYIFDVAASKDCYVVRYRAEDGTTKEVYTHKAFIKRVLYYTFVENDSTDLKISVLDNTIEEKLAIDLKSIERNGDKLTFLWEKGEPIVLTKAKEDKENLGTAFLYAYFMHIMDWSKAETHRFLDQLETSQDKKTREAKEKKDRQAKKVKEEEARKLKEYNKKVKKEAMRNVKETQFLRDVDKYIKEMK